MHWVLVLSWLVSTGVNAEFVYPVDSKEACEQLKREVEADKGWSELDANIKCVQRSGM